MRAGLAVEVRALEVLAIRTLERRQRGRHANDMRARSAHGTGWEFEFGGHMSSAAFVKDGEAGYQLRRRDKTGTGQNASPGWN